MNSNNFRCIFVNVLVNGAPYQNKVAIDIPDKDYISFEAASNEYALDLIKEISLQENLPRKFLSYEIVNEVTDTQKEALDFIYKAFNVLDFDTYINGRIENDKLIAEICNIGEITIHAKDIVIKE